MIFDPDSTNQSIIILLVFFVSTSTNTWNTNPFLLQVPNFDHFGPRKSAATNVTYHDESDPIADQEVYERQMTYDCEQAVKAVKKSEND
jgi:hypothetical protein